MYLFCTLHPVGDVDTEWQCDNEECIEPSYLCDYFVDCEDASDELQCQCKCVRFPPSRMGSVTLGQKKKVVCLSTQADKKKGWSV